MESSEPPPDSIYLLALLVLLLCSMFFSASETAFMSSSRLRIRYLREKKNPAAIRVERLLQKKDFFLSAILIGNNIVNISTSAIITALALQFFGNAGVGIATAFATVIILIFGEILPKSVALLRPERIALRFSLPLTIFILVATPVISVFSLLTRGLASLFGLQKKGYRPAVTEEDIKTLIEVGEEDGLFASQERDMMHKILKYTDLSARDIMIPRTDIVAIHIDSTRKEILALSHSSRYSRFPVYGEDIDDIRGILYIKDFLFYDGTDDSSFSVTKLLRPALFVFETQNMSVLQGRLRSGNHNIAVIIDEYGGTAGIVTTEDLVEEIFGGIRDEYDRPVNQTADSGEWIVEGSQRLADVNERFAIQLISDFYDTLGGFIMEKAGEIPVPGTAVDEQGYRFTVKSVSGNRIEEIRVERKGGAA